MLCKVGNVQLLCHFKLKCLSSLLIFWQETGTHKLISLPLQFESSSCQTLFPSILGHKNAFCLDKSQSLTAGFHTSLPDSLNNAFESRGLLVISLFLVNQLHYFKTLFFISIKTTAPLISILPYFFNTMCLT